MNAAVLVTGGAGFIGAHTCKALAKVGFTPVAYDSLARGHRQAVQWGPLIEADIRDAAALAGAIAQYKPVAVMHFAALALVGESQRQENLYRDVNIAGTSAIIDAMRRAGLDRLIFSGSCSVYGDPASVPVAETAPFNPQSVYARTKAACEEMLAGAPIRSVSLRYFNAAGADPDGAWGEEHDPETHLLPLALQAALGRLPPLTIFGNDYPTPDGTCIRDYVHVQDLAEAHVAALQFLLAGGKTASFNLGAGRGYSVRQALDIAARVIGRPIPHAIGPRRVGDPACLYADIAAARRVLGWQPKYPDLESQIGHAWAWFTRGTGR